VAAVVIVFFIIATSICVVVIYLYYKRKYQRKIFSTNSTLIKEVENEVIEEPKEVEEPIVETRVEVVQQETVAEVKPAEPVKSSGGFWSYFGWN
jgi:hypothetical protein